MQQNSILESDLYKVFSLLKWIEPHSQQAFQVWNNKIPMMYNHLYKVEKQKRIVMVFFKVKNLSEANFLKIYKKRNELAYLKFTLKQNGDDWVFIWELL